MRQLLGPTRNTKTVRPRANRLKIGLAALVASSSFVCACTSSEPAKSSAAPPLAPAAASPSQQLAQIPPPKLEEAQEVVKRIFKEAALMDSTRKPNFLAGDFNGDSSQDIAIVVKPAPGKLSEMNQESPPWILKDPFQSAPPGMPPLRVAATDVLLAVIHGYGSKGWRDPQATQTYLLKNAVGSDARTFSKNDLLAANQGKKLPGLLGDSIGEVLRGRSGYLYFAGATYSWYDPETFKGEPERRVIHPGVTAGADPSNLLNKSKREIPVEK